MRASTIVILLGHVLGVGIDVVDLAQLAGGQEERRIALDRHADRPLPAAERSGRSRDLGAGHVSAETVHEGRDLFGHRIEVFDDQGERGRMDDLALQALAAGRLGRFGLALRG